MILFRDLLNTKKWVKNMFPRYKSARNEQILNTSSEELMVLNPLEQMSKGDIAYLLPLFINDALKKDGSRFPTESLRQLICALFHYFRYELNHSWDFFRESEFMVARKGLDACMKSCTSGNRHEKKKS